MIRVIQLSYWFYYYLHCVPREMVAMRREEMLFIGIQMEDQV